MSMIRRDPPDNRVVGFVRDAGAGALVVLIAVVATWLVLQFVVAAVITIAAVLAIGAIVWAVFLRKR